MIKNRRCHPERSEGPRRCIKDKGKILRLRLRKTASWILGFAGMTILGGIYLFAADIEPISIPQHIPIKAAGPSLHPVMSAEGRYVAFESKASLTPDDPNNTADIYLFDRKDKMLKRIATSDPTRENGGPAMDSSGRYIAFHSHPRIDRDPPPPQTAEIYLYDQFRDRFFLVTVGRGGEPHDGEALYPSLSPDARFALLTSNATNLIDGKMKRMRQVYLYDQKYYSFELISHSTSGAPANRVSADPKMSEDGRVVAFRSAATNLLPGVPLESLAFHLYRRDRWSPALVRIDDARRGFDPEKWILSSYDMDEKGRVIVFSAYERNIKNPIDGLRSSNLFAFDEKKDQVTQMTAGLFENHAYNPSVSADGRYVAFVFRDLKRQESEIGVVVFDRHTESWRLAASGICYNPAISRDGSHIAFESEEDYGMPGVLPRVRNVFVVKNPFFQ